MTNTTHKSASQSLIGIKVLIMTLSLAGTLFGWVVLAAGQVRDAVWNQPVPTTNVPSSVTAPRQTPSVQQPQSPALRSVTGNFQPRARTRSSR